MRRLLTVRLVAFDLRRAYRLNPAATLRPEPFGALDAAGVPVQHWGRYAAALSTLAESEVIDERQG